MNPAQMRSIDLTSVLNDVTSTTMDGSPFDKDPYLWPVGGGNVSVRSPEVREADEAGPGPPPALFTANFPVGTDTGMLQEYVLRLNYTIHCKNLTQTEFPSTCPGNNPFDITYTNINGSDPNPFSDESSRKYHVRICAPGDTGTSPWKSTGDRQDISEEFYLDSQFTDNAQGGRALNNFTQHCTASTSMGYFELPNYYNNHTSGELLEELPPAPTKASPFDWTFPDPSQDISPAETGSTSMTPGPMMVSVLGVFGNGSFFNKIASQTNYTDRESMLVCEQLRQPFSKLQWSSPDGNQFQPTPQCSPTSRSTTGGADANALVNALFDWLPAFQDVSAVETAFNLTLYSAHKSLLTAEASPLSAIFSKPGYDIQKPQIPLGALIVITTLLSIQILCLAGLALYASLHHTWTNSLDAFALLRMGASLGREELPLISSVKASALLTLDEREGWIGASVPPGQQDDGSPAVLAIGGLQRTEENRRYQTVLNDGSWLYEKAKVPVVVRLLVKYLTPPAQPGREPRNFLKGGWMYRKVGTSVADE